MTKTTTNAFNGDHHLLNRVLELKEKYAITTFVETGTYKGDTTEVMAQHFSRVLTSEINQTYRKEAVVKLEPLSNVVCSPLDSRKFIQQIEAPNALFFLDAHWGADVPLIGELEAIAARGYTPSVIIIHDFFVPGKSTTEGAAFGFDSYNGKRFDWAYVEKAVAKIYGPDGFILEYPEQVAGAQRGYVIITPKQ